MTIDIPVSSQIPALRRLWKQAFGDTDAFLDAFFSTAFSPERCRCVTVEGKLAAALYWFDCTYPYGKLAYIYAVATEEACRGQGLCRALMADTHTLLASAGYAGAVLVPGSEGLFRFYSSMGYQTAGYVHPFDAVRADPPTAITQIGAQEYAALRRQYLPADGIRQEGENLSFLQTQAQLYKGDDFLLAAVMDGPRLWGMELLGNAQAAGGILTALGADAGHFRTPGGRTPFAMFLPFGAFPPPAYFGLAFD